MLGSDPPRNSANGRFVRTIRVASGDSDGDLMFTTIKMLYADVVEIKTMLSIISENLPTSK